MTQTTERPYSQRCVTCRHDHWQNELIGDCRALGRDVYHHNTEACASYEGGPMPSPDPQTKAARAWR